MSTLKIDPTTGDLQLTANAFVIESDASAETEQRLASKFKTFLGEWFRDTSIGLPYYQDILTKEVNLSRVKDIYREIILNDEQVDSLAVPVTVSLDSATRILTVGFTAKLNDGTYLEFAEMILEENK